MASVVPRVVVVTRASEYELLLRRHATHAQAAFFLRSRDRSIDPVQAQHAHLAQGRATVMQALPSKWRRAVLSREELSRFVFEPEDVVVAVGQDGLVANVAKYLQGQIVLGINPNRSHFDGVLVRHAPSHVGELLHAAVRGTLPLESRAMVQAKLDDGQCLIALNEIFVGHRSHQSARYRLRFGDQEEHHSSSGVIAATGTGATGWARSIAQQRASKLRLPSPIDRACAFFVREAFPSIDTGTGLTEGLITDAHSLAITSEINDGGVLFGDGIESDYLDFAWGMTATLTLCPTTLRLA